MKQLEQTIKVKTEGLIDEIWKREEGYFKCAYTRTSHRGGWGRKIGHKVCAY